MEQCQSLKFLTLLGISLDEDHCRVLGAYSRPDLEITLDSCKVTSTGASALAEVLGRNQGPAKLDLCDIDNLVLADGLRGNSRLKYLRPMLSSNLDFNSRQVLAIAKALRENKGLVELNFGADVARVSDEAWGAICESLKTHPTLEVLNLRCRGPSFGTAVKSRVQALVDMLKVNTSIRTIDTDYGCSHDELFRKSVIPYLKTNRFRPRLLSIQKTRPIPYRSKVLGRALVAARTDINRFWMLLLGNAEVAFPSTTATIAVAADLPTPTTTAASTNTAATIAAAASLPTAASDGLGKRKACP
jgi:hypothetical protein